ncbi:hypothetical protein [Paenibacillus sp. NEAU-GSW1]|uniref:hypothetical protein n=1 Tax=Paenibacillus sp. NEAU-GSW1 TaxID=2682486 RepID=UPI0012E0D462|nr:hypothetical protein [Paenibacillus sp. NEAU-GSW1]MUT68504.1 hypothetical protein [Paenibacillus sp. NEAU-GSW1]
MSEAIKAKLPEQKRIEKLTTINRNWFLEFGEWLKTRTSRRGKPYSPETISQMRNVVLNRLSNFGKTNANEIPIESFESFFNQERRLTTRNNKVNHIIAFYTFLSEEKKVDLPFEVTELNRHIRKKEELTNDLEGAAKALTIEEIILIRNHLINDPRRLFVFEMVYQYGLNLGELSQCVEQNYDFNTGIFKIKRNRKLEEFHVNARISNLINENRFILKPIAKTGSQDRFKTLGVILQEKGLMNKTVRWKDIEKTRERNFFRCPGCEKLYENTPDNWALIQHEIDEHKTKWIVCRSTCAVTGV